MAPQSSDRDDDLTNVSARFHWHGQSHQRRDEDEGPADDAEDLPPDFGRHGLLGDAMDERVTGDGGGRGEDERHDQARDR